MFENTEMGKKKPIPIADAPAVLAPQSTCITFRASKPMKWWKLLATKYYDNQDPENTDCSWHDGTGDPNNSIKETHVKFLDKKSELAWHFVIFHSTGTINVQGRHKDLETWINNDYPSLSDDYFNNDLTDFEENPSDKVNGNPNQEVNADQTTNEVEKPPTCSNFLADPTIPTLEEKPVVKEEKIETFVDDNNNAQPNIAVDQICGTCSEVAEKQTVDDNIEMDSTLEDIQESIKQHSDLDDLDLDTTIKAAPNLSTPQIKSSPLSERVKMAIMNSSKPKLKDDEVTISQKLFQIEGDNDNLPHDMSDCQSSSTPKEKSITADETPYNTSTTARNTFRVPSNNLQSEDTEVKTAPKFSTTIPPKVAIKESQPSEASNTTKKTTASTNTQTTPINNIDTEKFDILKNIVQNLEQVLEEYSDTNDSTVLNLQSKYSELTKTVSHIKSTVDSLQLKHTDVEQKNEKIRRQKEKINSLRSLNEQYRTTNQENKVEIALLKQQIDQSKSISSCREEFLNKIHDLDNQVKNREKEKQAAITAQNKAVESHLTTIEKTLSQKASNNYVYGLLKTCPVCRGKETITPPLEHTPITATAAPINQNVAAKKSSGEKAAVKPAAESGAEYCPNSDEEEEDSWTNQNQEERKKIKEEIILLMDSNRRFLKPDEIWEKGTAKKFQVSTAAEMLDIVDNMDLSEAKHIIIATGTNDTDNHQVDDVVHDIIHGAEEIHKLYPNAHIYVSELLPRRYNAQKETKQINKKLNSLLSSSSPIHLIKHQNLNQQHMYDDKHIHRKHINLVIQNILEEMEELSNHHHTVEQKPSKHDTPHRKTPKAPDESRHDHTRSRSDNRNHKEKNSRHDRTRTGNDRSNSSVRRDERHFQQTDNDLYGYDEYNRSPHHRTIQGRDNPYYREANRRWYEQDFNDSYHRHHADDFRERPGRHEDYDDRHYDTNARIVGGLMRDKLSQMERRPRY